MICPHCGREIHITPDEAARLMGAIGGKSTSKAKAEAARANGRKSKGRPKTTPRSK